MDRRAQCPRSPPRCPHDRTLPLPGPTDLATLLLSPQHLNELVRDSLPQVPVADIQPLRLYDMQSNAPSVDALWMGF